jgi:hypothetical protein
MVVVVRRKHGKTRRISLPVPEPVKQELGPLSFTCSQGLVDVNVVDTDIELYSDNDQRNSLKINGYVYLM